MPAGGRDLHVHVVKLRWERHKRVCAHPVDPTGWQGIGGVNELAVALEGRGVSADRSPRRAVDVHALWAHVRQNALHNGGGARVLARPHERVLAHLGGQRGGDVHAREDRGGGDAVVAKEDGRDPRHHGAHVAHGLVGVDQEEGEKVDDHDHHMGVGLAVVVGRDEEQARHAQLGHDLGARAVHIVGQRPQTVQAADENGGRARQKHALHHDAEEEDQLGEHH